MRLVRRGTVLDGPAEPLAASDASEASGCYRPHVCYVIPLLFLTYWSTMGPMSIFQGFAKTFYGDDAEMMFNIPFAVSGVLGFVSSPLLGALSDRYGRKPVLFFCSLFAGLPYVCLWVFDLANDAETYKIFLTIVGFSGIGGGGTALFGVCFAYIADTTSPDKRASISGLIMALGGGTAYSTSPLFFSWLYAEGERRDTSLLAVALTYGALALVTVLVPESNPASRRAGRAAVSCRVINPMKSFRLLGGDGVRYDKGTLRLLFSVVFLLYIMKMGFIVALGLFATTQYDFTTDQRSLLQTDYGAFQALGQLSIPLLVIRVAQRRAVGFGVASGLIACIIPAIPHIAGAWLFVSEAFLAVSFVAYTVSISIATQVVAPEFAGEAASLTNSALILCSGLGPLLFGVLAKAFSKTAYPGGAMLIFVVIVFADLLLCFRLPSDKDIIDIRNRVLSEEASKPEEASP